MATTQKATPFSKILDVKAISSHEYTTFLPGDWCIGSVPNGGVCCSVLLSAAQTHFQTTHGKLQPQQIHPITFHASFTIKTQTGPCTVKITDTKIGRSYSVIHASIIQDGMSCIHAIITMGNMDHESGPTKPSLAQVPKQLLTGMTNVSQLEQQSANPAVTDTNTKSKSSTSDWQEAWMAYLHFRKAGQRVRFWVPRKGTPTHRQKLGECEQYMRFEDGENFTNASLPFVADIFSRLVDGVEPNLRADASDQVGKEAKFWFPTLTLTMDFKRPLPETGTPFLFTRTNYREIYNGRNDVDVVILDVDGNLVATASHVALFLDASRNLQVRGNRKPKL